MDDSNLEEFSGIEEPKVLAKIKAILDEYRNDVQIIKELIQNADDAEATVMKILYEGRQLNKELPREKEYRKFFRSPALAVYNDAVFTDKDWRGIKAIYVSVKKDDPLKVGRFGLGFKSVFHLTDYPCVISGQYALFINPMEEDSKKICAMIKLKNMPKWTKLNFQDVMVALTDLFGISEDVFNSGYYEGTLFWFPLRQVPSQLSDDIYTNEEISTLLNAFIHDSEKSLLFLKTLCQIHVYCNLSVEKNMKVSQSDASTGLSPMNVGRQKPYYVVEINNDENTLQQERQQLLQEFKSIGFDIQTQSKSWVFNVYVQTKKISNGEKKESRARWLIVNYLKGGDLSEKMTKLLKDKHLGYPPIVAMAAAVHENGNYSNNAGHIFCYQPLPQHNESMTGLPVHINGFFALSQNRRQVSWPDVGENDIARNDKKIEWNITLASEVLPNAYLLLLMTLVKQSEHDKKFVHAAINTIPDLSIVDSNWKVLANSFLQLCKNKEILFSETGGGQWVRIHDAVFADFRGYPELSRGSQKTVITLLRNDEIKVVVVPDYIIDTLDQTFDGLQFVSQKYLAEHMKTSLTYKQLPSGKRQDLLEYFSQDSSYHYLEGLELVPLADGTFATFSPSNQLFVESQDVIQLFPGSAGSFVTTKLRKKTKVWMMDQVEKGTSCLQNLTSVAVAKLTECVLKENFDEEHTISIPREDVVRWKKWIKAVWDLIQSRFMDSLDDFQRLSIFPHISMQNWDNVDEFKLLPLNSLILHLETVEHKGLISKAFRWLSVTVIKFVPHWISENIKRKFLWYVEKIGEMFDNVKPECINVFNKNIDGPEAACLLEFLSKKIDSKLEETATDHLQKLHILRGHTTLTSSKLCCLQDQNAIYIGTDFPVKFPAVYIRLNNAFEQAFVIDVLGGKTVTELELITASLTQCEQYTMDEIKHLMYWILSSEKYFCVDCIQNKMREVPFVETERGQTCKPCELFDPSEMYLQDLFRGKDVFPSGSIHSKQDFLKRLKILGLKGLDHIMTDDLEMVASEVEKMSTNTQIFDEMKCKALLAVMEKRIDLIDKARMCDKRCILVKKDAVENYPRGLELRNRKSKPASLLCQPSDIKSVEFANIAGSVKFMIHCSKVPNLSNLFEWHTPPDMTDVVHHLFNIAQSFDKNMKSQCLQMIVGIYEWLSKLDLKQVINTLNSRFGSLENKYIWVGDGFHAPECVFIDAHDYDIDMRPYVHNIPTETSELKCFFKGIGCNQYQTLKLYVETLTKIKVISENKDKTTPDSKLLKIAVDILNTVKAVYQDHPDLNKDELYFPVVHDETSGLMMQPTRKCTFCDSQWLKDMGLELGDGVYYIHDQVPQSTAEALGVPSIHDQMLADAVPIEEWGQEEPLTRRLHALLKDGYVDGFSVAKELFQNADDARAQKLWIMYDERENNESRSNLLSDGMAECQGPAIWVYNDAKFKESDFENITKLNGATKKDDAEKIGKFGLGFCSVYNITDVPSFLSGHTVVMFDPHMTFLKRALPGKSPGLRINLQLIKNRKMVKVFKNQFQPFEGIFDCKIDDYKPTDFDGTLFRLPLRNKGSYISDIVYTSSEVRSLFEKIMKFSANMFIFNQSVVELKLFHLPKETKNPRDATLLFEIKKELFRLLPSQICKNPSCPVTDAVCRKRSNSLGETPLQLLDKNNIEVTQYTNANFKTQDGRFNMSWLVSWSTAIEKKCLELSQTERGALPLGAIAIPVVNNDVNVKVLSLSEVPLEYYQKGHLFFFLPLPIEHQFDFYINSQFSVSSDRKMLRVMCEDDKSTLMARWNECLFDDPITQALLYLLENIHLVGRLMNYHFEQLWPMSDQEIGVVDIISKSFYRNVVQPNGYKVFERDGKWFDISQCIFLDSELLSSNVAAFAMECLTQLSPFAVKVNPKFYDRLKIENEDLIGKLTVSKTDFFLKYFLPNLEIFKDNDRRNEMIGYAIKMNQEDINEWLKSNKCIPNLDNGELKRPNELVDPNSFLAALFERTDAFFPEKIFSHHDILGEMHNIGLMHETLNNDLLLILINSIQKEDKRCNVCASNLAGNVIAYVINKLSAHKAIEKTLQQVKFIPVSKRPLKWPFEWLADSYSMMKSKKCKRHRNDNTCMSVALFECASEIFHSECELILGSVGFIFNEDVLIKSHIRHNKQLEKVTLQKLGMKYKDTVPWKFVVSQLDTIIEAYKRQTHQSSNPCIDSIMQNIYQYLDSACSDHFDRISESLMGKESVFVANRFVGPSLIAKNDLPVRCHPYVFSLGETIVKDFPLLVKCLKVSEEIKPFALAMILQNIKISQREQPLNVSEVQAVLNLLFCLKAVLQKQGIVNAQTIVKGKLLAIFGPDENGFLQECNLMCFNDFDEIEKTEFMVYSHKLLSPDIAEFFGVLPKKLRYIEDNSEDIEDFYQNEPLVIRLQRILDGFPCDTGIFKELIQNADDAEATEIYFIKDFLPRSTENIAGSGFEHVQVPSLCIFNNSAFSNDDLTAITKLGEGNKANDSAKTGHYGIGFNAVYNLTDVPSFYTFGGDIENKETLCYFDPLAAFFPLVTREKPGKRIKNLKALRDVQSSLMASYHENLIFHAGKGTVFRLPLRLRSSEIYEDVITTEALSKLLESLSEELGEMLIFLKHLKFIRILTWTGGGYEEDYSFRIQMDADSSLARERIFQNFYDLSNNTKIDKMAAFQFFQKSEVYELSLLESQPGNKRHTDYIVALTVGFNRTAKCSDILRDKYGKGKVEMLPFGGVAVSVEKCLKGLRRKIRKNDSPVFCFLPLPIATKLPVLINGYFSLDNETRRNIWGSGNIDEMKWRTQWNVLIIEKVVTTAYVKLLDYTKDKIFSKITNRLCDPEEVHNAIEHFQDFFPVTNDLTDYWKLLVCSVYRALVENKNEFLPMQETETNIFAVKRTQCKLSWTSLYVTKHEYPAFVNAETVNRQVSEHTNSSKLNTLLRKVGMRIVFLIDGIIRSMEESGNKISPLTSDNVIKFLCSWSGHAVDKSKLTPRLNIAETPLVNVLNADIILKYCLKSENTFLENVLDIPLFVTEDLVVLSLKEEMPRYVDETGMYCSFFPCQNEKFIHKVIAKSLVETCREKIFENQNILQPFHMKDFADLAKSAETIPTDCETWISWEDINVSKEWVRQFWEFFQAELPSDFSVPHVKRLLQIVDTMPLIPVEVHNSGMDYLVPPHDIRRVITLESFQNNHNLHAGLTKLDLPFVQQALFVNSKNDILTVYKVLSEIIPNIQDAVGVMECLSLHVEKICNIPLDYACTKPILHFFDEGFGRNGELLTKDLIDKLKHLPLFKSHFGKLVKLSDYRTIHVVPSKIRSEGLEELANAIKVLFLEDAPLERLFSSLKIVELPIIDVYTKYIIPHQKELKRINFYRHLEFISRTVELSHGERKANELISILRETPFVEMPDHRFVKVNELYDPYHEVFLAMCEQRELLPRNLRKKSLVNLFKKIGLNDKMTMSLFVRFALEIEAKGNSDRLTKDIIKRSDLLTKYLLKADDEFIQNEDFSRLSDIHFVVPGTVNQNLGDIHAQFAEDKLIKFNGSYLSSSENVSWTIGNILPLPVCMSDLKPKVADQFCRHLSICLKPDRLTLLRHLKNVGTSVETKINTNCFTSNVIETLPKIFKDIYEALNTDINSQQHTSAISDSPVIYFPASKMILQPKMVVLACEEFKEVRPYFCRCPNEYGMFHSLFSNLGVHKEPTCTAYSSVLFKIKAKVEKNSDGFTSDDYVDAIKATGNFFKLLSQQSDKVVIDEDHLYLMSRQNTLENSQCLLVSNNYYFEDQLLKNGISRNRFLVGVDKLKDFHLHTDDIVDSLQWLTEVHRPHILTDIVHEQVVLEDIVKKDRKIAKRLQNFISSHHFMLGILRLVCHVRKFQSNQFLDQDRDKIISELQSITCEHCSNIKTIIAMRDIQNGKLGQFIKIDNTTEIKYAHLEKTENGACIYFDTTDRDWFGSVQKLLTLYLNKEKGLSLPDEYQMRLEEIIGMFESPHRIKTHLSKHKINDYHFEFDAEDTSNIPVVGNYVPEDLHQYLDNTYDYIDESEYKFMALEIDDPLYYIDHNRDSSHMDATYIFVHIIRKVGPFTTFHFLQEYEIDDGTENFKIVMAHKLYKFTHKPKEWDKKNQSVKDVCKEIKEHLKMAWQKPQKERKSIVKCLLFKWHPDKNPDNQDFCTKVFQFIQQCINALENGIELPSEDDEGVPRSSPSAGPSSSRFRWDDSWYHHWEQHYRSRWRRRRNRNYADRNEFWTSYRYCYTERQPYKWFSEAERWLKQAMYDLKDAKMSKRSSKAFNWICYRAYQAVEKSLLAAWYATDAYMAGVRKHSKRISYIAEGLDPQLSSLAERLEKLTGSCEKMLYPNDYGLPQDLYIERDAEVAIVISESVIRKVKERYNIM